MFLCLMFIELFRSLELQLLSYLKSICYFFLQYFCLSETLWKFRDPYISPQLTVLFLYTFLLVFHLCFFF